MDRLILSNRLRVKGSLELRRVVVHAAHINADAHQRIERMNARIGSINFDYESVDAFAM